MISPNLTIVTNQDLPAIDSYVKTHIHELYESKYKDFVPLIAAKIEDLCKHIFELSRIKPTSFLTEQTLNLDSEGANLLITCMARKYGFDFRITTLKSSEARPNSFDYDVLRSERPLQLACWWTPKNPHLFPNQSKLPKRLYQPDPAGCSKSLLIFAKKAVATDLILVSTQKEKIHAHSLLFKLSSEYFKTALSGSFKESKDNIIELPYSTANINNLVQFLYIGTIDSKNSDLIELLGMAHLFQIKDLFNFCIDLINEDLQKKTALSHQEIEDLITSADLYQIEDFFKPCLVMAESLEAQAEKLEGQTKRLESIVSTENTNEEEERLVVDWHKIPRKLHTSLLGMAGENGLYRVMQSLKKVVDHQYVLEDSTKGKEKA